MMKKVTSKALRKVGKICQSRSKLLEIVPKKATQKLLLQLIKQISNPQFNHAQQKPLPLNKIT